jgi:phage shock protein B
MDEVIIPIMVVGMLFIGLPWLILHYVTRWKANAGLTGEDEKLLDELYDLSRRLDDRMTTIERIISDENPHWKALSYEPSMPRLEKDNLADLGPRLAKEREVSSNQPSERRA